MAYSRCLPMCGGTASNYFQCLCTSGGTACNYFQCLPTWEGTLCNYFGMNNHRSQDYIGKLLRVLFPKNSQPAN